MPDSAAADDAAQGLLTLFSSFFEIARLGGLALLHLTACHHAEQVLFEAQARIVCGALGIGVQGTEISFDFFLYPLLAGSVITDCADGSVLLPN